MTPYSLGNISKRLVEALAIAIVYIATAQLGFLVAIPPGNVTVIWPPSGIALTAMLLLGSRAWAGIWLGSFLVNVFFLSDNMLLPVGCSSNTEASMHRSFGEQYDVFGDHDGPLVGAGQQLPGTFE
ncbi:MAG: MASE1 domain-containing protein, partial [Actinomycetota bacterium]